MQQESRQSEFGRKRYGSTKFRQPKLHRGFLRTLPLISGESRRPQGRTVGPRCSSPFALRFSGKGLPRLSPAVVEKCAQSGYGGVTKMGLSERESTRKMTGERERMA